MRYAFIVLGSLALAGCIKTPDRDTITRGEGVTIISTTDGNKVVKFDDGRLVCFNKFGDACSNFNRTVMVDVPVISATVTVPR